MNNAKPFPKTGAPALLLGALLLTTVVGCTAYVQGPRAGVYAEPAPVVFVAHDDYIYYPGYDVYYSSSRHQYAYLEGGAWVSRPSPRGVSVDVLLSSPSVRMDFHDSPANHHAEMTRRYPRNWAPSRSKDGRK